MVREGGRGVLLRVAARDPRAARGPDPAAGDERARLAAVLAEVYLLLPGFRAPLPDELDELRRLRALAA